MNKVLNINLGGYPLTIDDDAYEYLKAYLENIRVRFHESEGREEIMRDIEMRLGELLTTELGTRRIIMLPDVEEVVRIMGKPEDFGGEPSAANTNTARAKKSTPGTGDGIFGIKPGRRLFRDMEDKVAGGVCSGFASYLGIGDPLWVRLAFVIFTFVSAGFWIPAYLIFWVLIPEAKTAADRLSMRGEPINVDNIAREIEVGFGSLGAQMGSLGEEAKMQGRETAGQINAALAGIVEFIGKAFAWVVRFFGKFGIVVLVLAGIALMFTLLTTWIAGIWAFFAALPVIGYFSPFSMGVNYLAAGNLLLLVTIPIVGLIMTYASLLFKVKAPGWVSVVLGVVWTINLFALLALGGSAMQSYSQQSAVSTDISLSNLPSDTLRVYSEDSKLSTVFNDEEFEWDGRFLQDDEAFSFPNNVQIRVKKSTNGQFKVVQTVSARGSTNMEARDFALRTSFPMVLEGDSLYIPQAFDLKKGQAWRNQKVFIMIEMPVGKSITFDQYIYDNAAADYSEYAENNDERYISRNPGKLFTMTADGLVCADCPNWGDKDYSHQQDYEDFIIHGNVDAEIRKGDRFSFEVAPDYKNDVEIIRTGDRITFDAGKSKSNQPVPLKIFTPTFTSLIAEGNGRIILRGFDEGRASITAKGQPIIKAYMDCRDLDVNLQGPCRLELNGKGEVIVGNLAGGATLDAFGWKLERAEMSLSGNSTANLYVSEEHAEIEKDNSSSVNLQGK